MNYALKFQSSAELLKNVVTKINNCSNNDICGHCLHKHPIIGKKRREFATDATLMGQYLKKKRNQQKSTKNTKKQNEKTSITELMKVSANESQETILKIHQLRASDVKAFAERSGMTFEKEKFRKQCSYDSTRSYDPSLLFLSKYDGKVVETLIQDGENVDTLNTNVNNFSLMSIKRQQEISNTVNEVIRNKNLNDQEPNEKNNSAVEIKDDCEDSFYEPRANAKAKLNFTPKEYDFVRILQSYIDVAITSDNIKESLEIMKICRNKKIWRDCLKILNVTEIYNQLLHICANDWSQLCEVKSWMKSDKVPQNYQTYAVLLESLGINKENLVSEKYWKSKIIQILEEMKEQKMPLNKLFTHTIINHNQCQNILKAVHAVYPNFEVAPFKMKLNSKCSLLNNLYENHTKKESQLKDIMSANNLYSCVDKQIEVEKKFTIPVKAIEVNGVANCTPEEKLKYRNWEKKWKKQVHEGFLQSLKNIDEKKKFGIFNFNVYLKCLPADVYVGAMMTSIKNLVEYSGGFSPTLRILHKLLGEHIYERYQIHKKEKYRIIENTREIFKKYCDWYLDPIGPAKNTRQHWQLLCQEYVDGYPLDCKEVVWPDSIKIAVGKFLYDIILKRVKIGIQENHKERLIPVFYPVIRRDILLASEEIKCHPLVGKLFQKSGFDSIDFEVIQMPMLCPPKPWKSINHGGYLTCSVEFIRSPREYSTKRINLKKLNSQELYPTFDSLNTLQAVPWKINQPVLNVVLKVFKDGGNDSLDVPEFPSLTSLPVNITPDMTPEQRMLEYRKKKIAMMEKQNKYGLWCEALYRLSLANHFRNDIFWLPQNFDFRGRVYPVPPHLNHIGGDLFRSLLIFAKGKPLGPKGLDWLKIHTINLTGTHKKSSNQERLNYANTILPEILDSAENPLEGRRWWMQSEDRWQTLAACMEIKKALECDNPEEFVSHFPIHQDGSCNGLQHYAALGRDCIGAKSVNLTPCDKPQDVYDAVTQLIEKERAKDAKIGIPMAVVLDGFIRRKVVKQTIMTTVYGVTYFGAKLQIARQLEDIPDFPKKHVWPASQYLALKTFESLKQMFTSAKEIQDWFIQCAEVICQQKNYVQWVSPLGLPILQPYSKKQDITKKSNRDVSEPNTMKQKNAFPPNFVHSLDSTHMMLTAQYCEQANITFASIHDCYWTHACSIDAMNKICRQQFVALHSQPILSDLSEFFQSTYIKDQKTNSKALNVFTKVPRTGDFNLGEVLDSVYFFS